MKKIWLSLIAFILLSISVYILMPPKETSISHKVTLTLNVNDIKISKNYMETARLVPIFKTYGYNIVLNDKNNFTGSEFNLYLTDTIHHIPEVADKNAINLLWLPIVSDQDDLTKLRNFDVIIVKSPKSFGHLKAINMRTAFIPDPIDIPAPVPSVPQKKMMYFGDNLGVSIPLYLAGMKDMHIDIYGKGFEKKWPIDEIIAPLPKSDTFTQYRIVFLDQLDDIVRDELFDDKIIETLERGGIPFVRYNYILDKIFGNTLPMYSTKEDFFEKLELFMNSEKDVLRTRYKLYLKAQKWNSNATVQKIIEIFEIMKQKRRIPYEYSSNKKAL